ncbi:hypothetical protein [Spirosoma sp. KNUC1025]|uniref:hypothetical protein n=1 Tax=Spirosoma sp. KNUC1025 TaxID=2894082 RepID=UPI00386BEE37|nr:hypothetical protein LN737_26915 [Spirosoma sp. KNUC1025]
MIFRTALLFSLVAILDVVSYGQCTVSLDDKKRIITTCKFYAPNDGLFINRSDRVQTISQVVYLGSEYFSYPIWQDGTMEVGNAGNSVSCKLAFNLVTNEIHCQLAGDSRTYIVLPDAFTIGDARFVSQVINKAGKPERAYFMVLYAGKTRLLKQIKCTLKQRDNDVYMLEDPFNGTYLRQHTYYIQRSNEAPRLVTLSRKSVLAVLDDQSGKLTQYLTKKKLTVYELAGAVAYYDGFR